MKDDEMDSLTDAVQKLVLDFMDFAIDYEKSNGKGSARTLILTFIGSLVSTIVYKVLMARPEGVTDKKAQLEFNQKQFLGIKMDLQEAISCGMQKAMSTYTGKTVEYYCLIKTVPGDKNGKEC